MVATYSSDETHRTSSNLNEQNRQDSNTKGLQQVHDTLRKPLDHVDHADPQKIQCVAAANLELNNEYHKRILKQAQQSFYCAIITASLGFLLFSVATIFFMQNLTQLAVIGTVGTAITVVVSGTSFYLYRYTLGYFEDIHQCLARTELLLLGNSLCMQICDKEKKTDAYMELIKNVTQLTIQISKSEHKQN